MLTCRVDNDCFLGHICLHNKCVFGCHQDEDCSASESCLENKCQNPCEKNPCGPNALCAVVNQRASCSCSSGMVPSPSAKIGCLRTPAMMCAENRDCLKEHSCYDGFCRPQCSRDEECLNSERCDQGACKQLCRVDSDCQSADICQGLTCSSGCRNDLDCPSNLVCDRNRQCNDPCKVPATCGTNTQCTVVEHKVQCSCIEPLVGDPKIGCKNPLVSCKNSEECENGKTCYGNQCRKSCRINENCLSDEKCVKGACRSICNADSQCDNGLICKNRICEIGCRNDNVCEENEACVNGQCKDPCTTNNQCGSCADCKVFNHGMQCVCQGNFIGDPLIKCMPSLETCSDKCTCDESGKYCIKKCKTSQECSCGQVCQEGSCHNKCDQGKCPFGQLCQQNLCKDGCKSNADCSNDLSCINNKCKNPCIENASCGLNALCRVAEHKGNFFLMILII